MLDCFSTVHNPCSKTLNADSAHLQYDKNEFWSIKKGGGEGGGGDISKHGT